MSEKQNRFAKNGDAGRVTQEHPAGANGQHVEASVEPGSNGQATCENAEHSRPEDQSAVPVARPVPAKSHKAALARVMSQLSEPQHRALALLREGTPIAQTARKIGINRGTIYRWIDSDPYFKAAYNAWQQEQRESCRAGLLACAHEAVERIRKSIAIDARLAFQVAKQLRLFDQPGDAKTVNPDLVEHELGIRDLRAESRLVRQHLRAMLRKMGIPDEQAKQLAASPKKLAAAVKRKDSQAQQTGDAGANEENSDEDEEDDDDLTDDLDEDDAEEDDEFEEDDQEDAGESDGGDDRNRRSGKHDKLATVARSGSLASMMQVISGKGVKRRK